MKTDTVTPKTKVRVHSSNEQTICSSSLRNEHLLLPVISILVIKVLVRSIKCLEGLSWENPSGAHEMTSGQSPQKEEELGG